MQTFVAFAKGESVEVKAQLVVKECHVCHMLFAMPEYLDRQAKEKGADFAGWYCPAGHSAVYRDGELQKVKNDLARASEDLRLERQWKEREREQRLAAENKAVRGVIEIDECFVGGKEANKHEHKKLKAGRGSVGKTPVLGMRERGAGGRTVAITLDAQTLHAIQSEIHGHVEVGSTLYTDENPAYADLNGLFFRAASVNHGAGEYARGPVSTNSIESVWAVLKRGLHGVYHHASPKHLGRYVDEFTFRLNEGNVERHTLERLDSFVDGVAGKRLTYARLTA